MKSQYTNSFIHGVSIIRGLVVFRIRGKGLGSWSVCGPLSPSFAPKAEDYRTLRPRTLLALHLVHPCPNLIPEPWGDPKNGATLRFQDNDYRISTDRDTDIDIQIVDPPYTSTIYTIRVSGSRVFASSQGSGM